MAGRPPLRREALALHDDRALAAGIEEGHAAALRPVADRRLDLDAVSAQLRLGVARVRVVAERREERRRPAELCQLDGGDRTAAGRFGPPLVGVPDLAGERHARYRQEVDPFDVTDHREPRHDGDDTGRRIRALR